MAERKVEEFVWVLLIAIILIIIVGIFSYFVPYTGPYQNITMGSFSPGEVGYVQDYVARSMDLKTFTVGEQQSEPLKSWPQMELATSMLGGNTERAEIGVPDYHLETARGVRITFDLYQTNNYGNLVIRWNGRDVVNGMLPPRQHEVFIDRADVRESNILEVFSTGPGFYFWASSIYIIKNFNVNLEYGPHRVMPFEILPSEMDSFDRAEVSCYASGTGILEIRINGVSVYSGSPAGMLTEGFTLFNAPVRAGQNIITFVDETGTYTLRDTMFRIYITGDQSRASHRFNISEEHYSYLAQSIFRGKVDYMIDGMARQGSIDVELNGHPLSTPAPRTGWNSAYFTAAMASPGENRIVFSGTGSFDISEAIIGLER
jgi:hypothetical protein